MKIAMVGLGKMGANMTERLRRAGHQVVGYDRDPDRADVGSLAAAVAALDGEARRVVWLMVPSGGPTNATVEELARLLSDGDLVVDGGNSHFRDSMRHAELLARLGVGFVDAGVSGGVWGLSEGYCIMAGGDGADIDHLRPIVEALVTDDGFAHVGPAGTGHFVKMVHNGVEYALMQAYAEGYELLTAVDLDIDVHASLEVWRHGSVVRSWLLDLLADALADDPGLASVRGYAEDSGAGRWTVEEAIANAVPVPAISAALFARFASRQPDSPAMKAIATLRNRFGGHGMRAS
ncbi:phosphogluconate dehydrogenase (NAD(+)-dependent, decarboxylating) [Euzebya sp.]|uniref:phosphogluconate dehydrogenase (NAD(+)-dependent, decarboxylating) n=1 Tax=Euzebya sp. TaxID=1971409 RepID=UPI0035187CA9